MTRPSTNDGPATLFDQVATTRLDRAFEQFHAANPGVYDTIRDLALELRHEGHEKAGIKMLWEVARWKLIRSTKGDRQFKLNNNLTSRYARLLMDREPDLAGMFDLRELRGQ